MCLTGGPQGSPEVMLQTGCTDCMVIYINNYIHGFPLLMLLSKSKPRFPSSSGDFLNVSMCKSIQAVWITLLVQLTANWGCTEHVVVEVDDDIPLVKQIEREILDTRLISQGFYLWCFLSRTGKRQTVSETELTEFNTQAECLGWAKPIVLGTDHGNGKISTQAKK